MIFEPLFSGGTFVSAGVGTFVSAGAHLLLLLGTIKVFIKRKILSIETVPSAYRHTSTHTLESAHTGILAVQSLIYTQLKTYCWGSWVPLLLRKLSASFPHRFVTAPVPVATCGTLCVRWLWGRTSFLAWPCPPCVTSRSGCWGRSASVTCPKWVSWLIVEDHVLVGLRFGFIRVGFSGF